MRTARKLHVVCIDDKPPSFARFVLLETTALKSMREVQDYLLRNRTRPVDLVICDVNMKYNKHPAGLVWGEEGDEPAYGPVLALPYAALSEWCELVPRSAHWPQVRSNGYVLTSLALMLSLIRNKPVSLQDAVAWIDEQTPSTDLRQNLNGGLHALRARLEVMCADGRVSVAGVSAAIDMLERWTPGQDLVEPDGCPLFIEIISGTVDRVMLASLFSDLLGYSTTWSRPQIAAVTAHLRAWYKDVTGMQFERHDDVYQGAVRLISNDLPDGGADRRHTLEARAQKESEATQIDKLCLIRTAILFAFLRAWYFWTVSRSPRFAKVQKPSAKKSDRQSYYTLMDWVYFFLDIEPSTDPANKFARLLGEEEGNRRLPGVGPYQTPFRSDAANGTAFEAYASLRENAPADLTAFDRALCLRFLADERSFFPAGMTADERVLWAPQEGTVTHELPTWLKG